MNIKLGKCVNPDLTLLCLSQLYKLLEIYFYDLICIDTQEFVQNFFRTPFILQICYVTRSGQETDKNTTV